MLNIHNLSVSFGGTYLFEEVTFRLGAGDRVGLVGKNGAGKSTMLKMLARDFAPDSGVISQDLPFQLVTTILFSLFILQAPFLL